MFPKNRGSLLVLGSLLTVTTLGSWGCCSVTWCDPAARIVIVKAKDAARTGPANPTVISKKKHQQIAWTLPSGSPYTNVAINLGGHPEPFVACETTNGVCHIACEHRVCLSGSINPLLAPPAGGTYYDYDFASLTATSTD